MKSICKDHRIYCEKAYKIERQDIVQTLDETKNHSHKLTVTFRTCLNIYWNSILKFLIQS